MLSALTLAASLSFGWFDFSEPEPPPEHVVEDLHYGDVLFYYFQEEYFESMTRLMAAREMGRAEEHAVDGELLMGGMLLSWGQHRQAAEIFQRLLNREAEPEVRDQAWFYLALISYQRGAYPQALAALREIGETLEGQRALEKRMLEGQVLMALGRFDDAATILSAADWDEDEDWLWYARYNLGVALVRAGRLEAGADWLAEVGSASGMSPERLALRDRANVALGYTLLQNERPEDAEQALQRVRLQGPSSNQALLGYGWARLEQEDYNGALVAWQELAQRDLRDPAVQEALIAAPYVYGELEAWGAAADGYEQAMAAYADEVRRIDGLIERVASGDMIDAMLADDRFDTMSWTWTLDEIPDSDETRYLLPLFASHRFQEGLKNVRDLYFIQARLDERAQDAAAYDDMIATGRLRFAEREPRVRAAFDAVDLPAVAARAERLETRYREAVATRDVTAFASPEQRARLQRIDALLAEVARREDTREMRRTASRLRLLRGVILWDLEREFDYQVFVKREDLDAIAAALADAQAQHADVRVALDEGPLDFDAFDRRVDDARQRIDTLSARSDALARRGSDYLKGLAIDELRAYQQRLREYTIDARFALARLYDNLSASRNEAPQLPVGEPSE